MDQSKNLLPIGKTEFVLMMAALMSLNALAIDIMLPALGMIAEDYALTNDNDRQWVISIYLFGMGAGAIFYGSLSDRYGRKPILLTSTFTYGIFAILCAISDSFSLLLTARFLQGFAAAAMGVLAQSIVRDRLSGDYMAQLMSTIMMVFMAVPVLAPIIGQFILIFAPWYGIFLFLALFAVGLLLWVYVRLPETLNPDHIIAISPPKIAHTWSRIFGNRSAMGHVLASGLVMAPLFAFVTTAQQIFFDIFDAADIFVFVFGINAGAMALANYLNTRIVLNFGARRVSQTALLLFLITSTTLLLMAQNMDLSMPVFVTILAIAIGTIGLTQANFSAIAMQPFGQMAGAASSFQNFIRTLIAIGFATLIGQQFDGTVVPLLTGFVLCGLAALLIILWAEKWKLMQRPNKP